MTSENLFFEGFAAPTPSADRRHQPPQSRPLPRATGSTCEPGIEFIRALLAGGNLAPTAYRVAPMRRRVAACLRFLGESTVDRARERIAADPALARATLNVALLGVTEFFRDDAVFRRLRTVVLPELCARHARLRVWSAGCSAGHELFSVAMALADAGRLRGCRLLGSDCREGAIIQARHGRFSRAEVAGLEPAVRERYFAADGAGVRISPELCRATEWKVADLCSAVEPGPWDLILWRNMAIYLEDSVASAICHSLCEQLVPGGYLICGKADHPPRGLPLVRVSPCIYQHTS